MERQTGRIRYRVLNRFMRSPVMVLQLELEGFAQTSMDPYDITDEKIRWWRDARPQDITIQEGE